MHSKEAEKRFKKEKVTKFPLRRKRRKKDGKIGSKRGIFGRGDREKKNRRKSEINMKKMSILEFLYHFVVIL